MTGNQNINLFDIISYVETKNNPHLIRFEPIVYANISKGFNAAQKAILESIQKIHLCSFGTAQMIYSTSWGSTQIMGFNLYGMLEYKEPVWTFGDDPIAQAAMFNLFCEKNQIDYTVNQLESSQALRRTFALKYNGDAVAYTAMIDQALTHFGGSYYG
jgi:hypothetical protein